MAFDHVAEADDCNVAGRQLRTVTRVSAQALREPTFDEVRAETSIEHGSIFETCAFPRRRRFASFMAEDFTEAEGMHEDFHGTTTKAGGDLARKQFCGRARDE